MTDAVLETVHPNPDYTPGYIRVSTSEAAKFLRLRSDGLTIKQIAECTNRSVETVHRRLQEFETDTRPAATSYLNAKALDAAIGLSELTEDDNPKVRLDANKAILQANKLLGNEDKAVTVGIQVVIGMPVNQSLQVVDTQAVTDTAK